MPSAAPCWWDRGERKKRGDLEYTENSKHFSNESFKLVIIGFSDVSISTLSPPPKKKQDNP